MALSAAFLDELKARVSLATVAGRRLVFDRRKSNMAKGDLWACCPFHGEKTASFHIDERKGYYYCFGCHEKGSVIDFVMKTQNLSFPEAVRLLAEEAGLPLPNPDPRAAQREAAARGLHEACEAAALWFATQLRGARAHAARHYLHSRGFDADMIDRFGIGYAPPDRRALADALQAKGFALPLLIEAGLVIKAEDSAETFDRFRDRIIFPIHDARGRCIAFGGRAMAADARAKYLNSPETPLFHKGRTLYNLPHARARLAQSDRPLVVAEGYVDVIALDRAQFPAVAPLGTAITEAQLRLLWRLTPVPVLALDGDKAGQRAAARAAELALPLLTPGKSLRFALMPEGQDPDDVLRQSGAEALAALIAAATPLAQVLWQQAVAEAELDSPEGRAAFDNGLKALLARIADPSVRRHYQADFRNRRQALFAHLQVTNRTAPPQRFQGGAIRSPSPALGTTLGQNQLANPGQDTIFRPIETIILLTAVNHPELALEFAESLDSCAFRCADLDLIRGDLLSALAMAAAAGEPMDHHRLSALRQRLIGRGPSIASLARLYRFAQPQATLAAARKGFAEVLAEHQLRIAKAQAQAEAMQALLQPDGADAATAAEARIRAAHREQRRRLQAARAADVAGQPPGDETP